MRLELGCGNNPTDGFLHHDKWLHSTHVDIGFDLEQIPWPLADNSCIELLATDVFEHLCLEVHEWLGECWRVLMPNGMLRMRLPSWNHPLGYGFRDITHRRVFHRESFLYFCPNTQGSTLYENFGRYYWGPDYHKWWKHLGTTIDCDDISFCMSPLKEGSEYA